MKNGMVPLRMMGNKPSSALPGQYLLLLVMFKLIWPQASYFNCIAFIANESDDARLFFGGKSWKNPPEAGLHNDGDIGCCVPGVYLA
jgi:hypothetical protein